MVQVCTRFAIESTPISSSLALIPVERSSSVADTGVLQSRRSAARRAPRIAMNVTLRKFRAVMAAQLFTRTLGACPSHLKALEQRAECHASLQG